LRADDRALVDAAALVADGAPVDWVSAESAADADNRRPCATRSSKASGAFTAASLSPSPAIRGRGRASQPGDWCQSAGPHWAPDAARSIGQGPVRGLPGVDTALHREVALAAATKATAVRRTPTIEEARRLAACAIRTSRGDGAEEHGAASGSDGTVRGESLEQTVHTRGTFGARVAAIGLDPARRWRPCTARDCCTAMSRRRTMRGAAAGRCSRTSAPARPSGTNRLVGTPCWRQKSSGASASVQASHSGRALVLPVSGKFPVNAGSMEELSRAHGRAASGSAARPAPDLHEVFVACRARARQRFHAAVSGVGTSSRRSASRSTRPRAVPLPRRQSSRAAAVSASRSWLRRSRRAHRGAIVWSRS
jgi:hypothetical protein